MSSERTARMTSARVLNQWILRDDALTTIEGLAAEALDADDTNIDSLTHALNIIRQIANSAP